MMKYDIESSWLAMLFPSYDIFIFGWWILEAKLVCTIPLFSYFITEKNLWSNTWFIVVSSETIHGFGFDLIKNLTGVELEPGASVTNAKSLLAKSF